MLPVHDSFIVRTGYDDHLRHAMEELFRGLFPAVSPEPVLTASKDLEAYSDRQEKEGEPYVGKDQWGMHNDFATSREGINRDAWLWRRAERHKRKWLKAPTVHTRVIIPIQTGITVSYGHGL